MTRWTGAFVGSLALVAGPLLATAAGAQETEDRLLKASEGLQMPGAEADSAWWFVSYPHENELPSVERFSELAGCDSPEGGVSRQNFDATLDHLGDVQSGWTEARRRAPAASHACRNSSTALRRTRRLPVRDRHSRSSDLLLGVNEDGLSGLLTVNIET